MRIFHYPTVGKILEELKKEGVEISRSNFYSLAKSLNFPEPKRMVGEWRTWDKEEANLIKSLLRKYANSLSVGKMLEKFQEEGLSIPRSTFYRLLNKLNLPITFFRKNGQRMWNKKDSEIVKEHIKQSYWAYDHKEKE